MSAESAPPAIRWTPHPSHCATCNGTGWQDGPSIWTTVHGRPHEYTTVAPCEHRWWDDDPDPTP